MIQLITHVNSYYGRIEMLVKVICQLTIFDDRFIAVTPLIHPEIISILNLTLHNISIIIKILQ